MLIGESATGKTSLCGIISDYNSAKLNHEFTRIKLEASNDVVVVHNDSDETILNNKENRIMIIDEDCSLLHRYDTSSLLQNSNNYFLIICRKLLDYLPVSVDNIYCFKKEEKTNIAVPLYQRFQERYFGKIDIIITEDSRSGRKFFEEYFHGIEVKSAESKSQVALKLEYEILQGNNNILVVYDAAAFGYQISAFIDTLAKYKDLNVKILDWDSFECYLLGSSIFDEKYTQKDMDCYSESLEQFCTDRLCERINYHKGTLPKCFKMTNVCGRCDNVGKCKFKHSEKERRTLLVYGSLETIKN
jgi:hypothetical protein